MSAQNARKSKAATGSTTAAKTAAATATAIRSGGGRDRQDRARSPLRTVDEQERREGPGELLVARASPSTAAAAIGRPASARVTGEEKERDDQHVVGAEDLVPVARAD